MKDSQFNPSRLIERKDRGKEIIIAKHSATEVRFTPVVGEPIIRHPGRFGGEIKVIAAFFEALADDDLAAWEGSSEPMK